MKSMKLILAFTFLIFIFCMRCPATINGEVKGKVMSFETKIPLENITVRVFRYNNILVKETKTDRNGNYQIKNIKPDIYIITFEAPFETGLVSMPIFDCMNVDFVGTKAREFYRQNNLEFELHDGETKIINKKLGKGVKTNIKINLINGNLEDFSFNFKDENSYYLNFEVFAKTCREIYKAITQLEENIVLPPNDTILITGNIKNPRKKTEFFNIKKEFIIVNLPNQKIDINYNISDTLDVEIIMPVGYKGYPPSCSIWKKENNFNYDTFDINEDVTEFREYKYRIIGIEPGRYAISTILGVNFDENRKASVDYKKYLLVDIKPGGNYLKIEF